MIDLDILRIKKVLGVGCSTFGGSTSKKTSLKVLSYAFDKGLIYYDLARSYGYGEAESIVGQFAKGKRDKIIIASKFGILPPRNIPFKNLLLAGARNVKHFIPKRGSNTVKALSGNFLLNHVFTPELAARSLDKTLRELGTDYIDIFLFHESKFSDMLLEDVIHVLNKEKEKGKLRAYGGTFKDRNDLEKIVKRPDIAEVVQFPFGLDNAFCEVTKGSAQIQIIYSILNHDLYLKFSDEEVLRELKFRFPELGCLENITELKLFLAFVEVAAGVLLTSTKRIDHINRNLSLIQQPFLVEQRVKEIKDFLGVNVT
jgi:aryl-alcohol dehydrogenase-like predicted oxidoreductase